MNSDEFIFPKCETIEKKEDKRIWYWEDCIEVARKSGAKMGTLEFWTVYRYRVYETHGRYGFCVAGFETLAADLGVSVEQMKTVHQNLCRGGDWGDGRNVKPRLYHIWCDKKVYRNKTKIYVTEQWLKDRGLTAEQIKVLSHGRSNTHKLTGKIGENGEIIEAEIVKNELEATYENVEATYENVEATYENVEATYENVESPLMNKLKNVCKGMSENEPSVTNVTGQMPMNTRNDDASQNKQDIQEPTQLAFSLEEDVNQTPDQKQAPSSVNDLGHELNSPSSADPPSHGKVRKVDENGKVCGGNPLVERAYELWNEIMGQPCKRDKWNSQAGWNMMRAKDKGEEWLRGMIILARECKKDSKAHFKASHIANLADLQKNQEYVLDWYRKKQLEKNTPANKSIEFLRGIR